MKFFLLLTVCLAFASCSIPQVEDAKCTVSRDTVRSFYSDYFANSNQAAFSRETIGRKEKFLSADLYKLLLTELDRRALGASTINNSDPFIDSTDEATGFKVGECTVGDENHVTHTVRLFWKIDNKPTIGEIKVKTYRDGDKWLICDFVSEQNGSLCQSLDIKNACTISLIK